MYKCRHEVPEVANFIAMASVRKRCHELIDHKHDVSAGKLSANFEAAVSKALCKEDEVTLVIWHQQKKRLLKPSHSVFRVLTKGV